MNPRIKPNYSFRSFGLTDTGKIKNQNDDRFLIKNLDGTSALLAVADGLGGQPYGYLAAEIALNVLDGFHLNQGDIIQQLKQLVKTADIARLTEEDWQKERDRMLQTCNQCHSKNFAKAELAKGDQIIKDVDHLMAKAIRLVADLYADGILEKPEVYSYPFPDLLAFHDTPTVIENKLFVMFLKHRMRAFQGMFHANPDYALWYGWSEMRMDLTEIEELAAELREREAR